MMTKRIVLSLHNYPSLSRHKGYSLIEVLVSVAILLTGILSIVNLFPMSLRAQHRAADVSRAAFLAQLKAEEIRRDNDRSGNLMNAIRSLTSPTEILTFPCDTRFSYCFCGVSLIDPRDDPDDPRDDYNIPRVIVMYSKEYRGKNEILYELRFDQ
jgi:prepilin-type N-terminal cleavage/methylation domain-containing protein